MTTTPTSNLPQITLARGKARPIWAGHPWIYSGAIKGVSGEPDVGSVVSVVDHKGQFLGFGSFNPNARIAVRMLGPALPEGNVGNLIAHRIEQALENRKQFGLPDADTTAYRLINGEGDGLPGIFCDIFGDLASVEITTAAAEQWLPFVMTALKQPNVCVRVPPDSAKMEGIAPGERFGRGEHEEFTKFQENGITWALKPGKGQKTGFYTDQRENRKRVAQLARGKTMLDCFCYTGGFALNAALAGATKVIGVDSSGPAVSVAAGTAEVNSIANSRFYKEDVIRYLKQLGDEQFDVVVMDPPKLARSRQSLHDAYKKYRAINVEGIKRVSPGGIFVSCTCSSLVNEEMFLRLLTDAAHLAERRLVVHHVGGPGPDHPTPAAFPEGRYLTVVVASVPMDS